LGGVQVGDRVDGDGAPAVVVQGADAAGQAEGLGGVGEVQAGDGGCLQAADLGTTVAAVAGVVGNGELLPGQELELVVQRGLVAFDDQQVGGVLVGDQPVGVLTLGVHGVGGDDPSGQVQVFQQRPEPGDLIGLGVDVDLSQDGTTGVLHRRQQVHRGGVVVAAAAQGLAVDGDCLPPWAGGWWRGGWWWLVPGSPGTDGTVQRVGVDAAQHTADGGLVGWPGGAGPGVAAYPERGQDRAGRISGPLTDRGQRSGSGEHGDDRDAQHRSQGVPSAASVAWVGELGEVVEQTTALVGCQRGGRGQPMSNSGDGG
jgi:hypothetical protein